MAASEQRKHAKFCVDAAGDFPTNVESLYIAEVRRLLTSAYRMINGHSACHAAGGKDDFHSAMEMLEDTSEVAQIQDDLLGVLDKYEHVTDMPAKKKKKEDARFDKAPIPPVSEKVMPLLIDDSVLNTIRAIKDEGGISVEEIILILDGAYSREGIHEALSRLERDNYIYHTIDDNHFATSV
jgi:hypothetical protein